MVCIAFQASRIFFSNDSEGVTIGRRVYRLQIFINSSTYFTPVGFPSSYIKPLMSSSLKVSREAILKFLWRAALVMAENIFGKALAKTEITPTPPMAMIGAVNKSSPDISMKSFGALRAMRRHCSKLPEASFTPIIFLWPARGSIVSAVRLEAVRSI